MLIYPITLDAAAQIVILYHSVVSNVNMKYGSPHPKYEQLNTESTVAYIEVLHCTSSLAFFPQNVCKIPSLSPLLLSQPWSV